METAKEGRRRRMLRIRDRCDVLKRLARNQPVETPAQLDEDRPEKSAGVAGQGDRPTTN